MYRSRSARAMLTRRGLAPVWAADVTSGYLLPPLTCSPLAEEGGQGGDGGSGGGESGGKPAEGTAGGSGGAGEGAAGTGGQPKDANGTEGGEPEPKTYDEAYVKRLRDEAASHRTGKKAAEDALEAEKSKSNPPDQQAIDKARREASVEATGKANQRVLGATVRALAASGWQDPADAAKYLDMAKFGVSDDGDVDEKAVADALADVLKAKPYLAKAAEDAGKPARPAKGSADGGARGGGGTDRPKTLADAISAKYRK